MWPTLLDMTKEESMQHLRCLEIDAFSTLVNALRAQGGLDSEKLKILKDTGSILHISQERHKAEIRRVVNDERLNTIAYHVNGEKHCADEWAEEGQRLIPLMARVAPQTAYSAIADEVADTANKINKQLPNPASTERKRPSSISPTHSNASTSEQCNKNLQFRMSEPDIKKRKLSLNLENSNLAQHLMGPPKISKIQQIYRQKTKARQKEQQLMKLKQDFDKSEFIQLQQITVSKPLQVVSQPQKVQPKVATNQSTPVCTSQNNPKINILQNISIQTAQQNSCDEQKSECPEEEKEPAAPQPGCSSENQTVKIINKVLTNATINKVNQLTIKTSSVTSDLQKTIKVCATRKTLPTKTVTTSSGQKLIVVSNPQTLTTTSILQRTLTTIPFKNISVKNFDKFKIVPTTSSQQTLSSPIQLQNSKQKVVTVRTATNKKVIPFSQVQVLNTKGGIKVLPLGGKIISKTNPSSGPLYFMNTTSGETTKTKSITSTPVLMSSKPQENSEFNSVIESENNTSLETSTNVPSLVSDLILEDKAELTDIVEKNSEVEEDQAVEHTDAMLDIKDVDLLKGADEMLPNEAEDAVSASETSAEDEYVEKVEADSNSFYIIDGENASNEILIDGLQINQPLEILNLGSLDPMTGKYSEHEQENASVVESHILETEEVEPDFAVQN